MNKKTQFTIIFLGLAAFITLGCQIASQVLPTSTPAPTFTPASTLTPTLTPTPTPKPDISAAVLTLDDLPAGFEAFALEELGMSMADFGGEESFQPENVFIFINSQNIQMIFGFNFLLTDKLDRVSFDAGVSQPEVIIPAFVSGMGTENVHDEKVLEGIDDIGGQQIGMTMIAELEGLSMQVDVLMFRRDIIGEMVMSMTMEGKKPNITIHDLGLRLDQKAQESLQSLK